MSRHRDAYLVERYNGEDLYVDAEGVFFAKDDDGARGTTAKTLAELKRKLAGPHTKLDLRGVMFSRWSYNHNEAGDEHREVRVYGVSGVGNVLYEENGCKEKAGRGEDVYIFDQSRLDERLKLRRELRRIDAALEQLMEQWPKVERKGAP